MQRLQRGCGAEGESLRKKGGLMTDLSECLGMGGEKS